MLSKEVVDKIVARLALMPFFQASDKSARATVTEEIISMATCDAQVIWLGHRMLQLYPKQWPGIVELRACFCKRFKPADGVQVNSAVYFQEDGYPTEAELGEVPGLFLEPTRSEREALLPPAPRQLEAGEPWEIDPELCALVRQVLNKSKVMQLPRSQEQVSRELYRPRAGGHPNPPSLGFGGYRPAPTTGPVSRITPEQDHAARQAELDRRRREA